MFSQSSGRRLLASLLVTLSAGSASAQVNTEKMRSPAGQEGFGGSVDGVLAIVKGNNDLIDLGAGVRVQHETLYDPDPDTAATSSATAIRPSRDLVFVVGNIRFGKVVKTREGQKRSETFVNNGFAHVRWTRMWLRALGSELFGQYQFNEFIRLKRRALFGAGARVALVQSLSGEIHAGTGAMLELEELDVPEVGPDEQEKRFVRSTSYLSFKLSAADGLLSLINTTYFQPRVDDLADFRLLDEAEVMVAVGKSFAFGVSSSVRYDSRPPAEVKNADFSVTNTLRYRF